MREIEEEVKKRTRSTPVDRQAQILAAAVDVARAGGYLNMTREGVARHAGVSVGLVSRYFDDMVNLRKRVMEEAIRLRLLTVVAQGMAVSDPTAMDAPADLKAQAAVNLGGL